MANALIAKISGLERERDHEPPRDALKLPVCSKHSKLQVATFAASTSGWSKGLS
jgi:hypothetical protein